MQRDASEVSGLWHSRGGQGDKLLLLLHGLGANASVWDRMIPLIEESWDGRWLAPDLRGHGRSFHRGPYGFGVHAADIAALVKDERPGKVSIVGHSFGGVVGAMLATGWFGPQIAMLFAFGVKLNWSASEVAKSHEIARKPARTFAEKSEAIDRYLKISGLFGIVDPRSEEASIGIKHIESGYHVAMDPRAFEAVGPSIPGVFSQVSSSFRLAAGENDPMVTADEMRQIDKNAVVFPGLGHNAHCENPEAIWRVISEELSRRPIEP